MVRRAVKEDIKYINELGLVLNKKFTKLFDMEEILKEEYSRVYVYTEDEKVVGFLHITVLYDCIDIVNICVSKEYRRKKIATYLLDYMFSDFDGKKLFTLEVNTSNEAAINLYKKFGFEIIHTRDNYYEDNDAYLMGRES